MARKDARDMRTSFVKEMDELAFNLAGAVKRLPSNMLTEKIDAFKALTQYANTINRTPVSEEGNAIDQFREALGVAPGAGGAARGGDSRSAADDGDTFGDGDGDDADDESDSDDDAESADAESGGSPDPSAGVSGSGNGAGGPSNGFAVGGLRSSVRLPDDQ